MVQVCKNRRFHRGIGRSPYEALFGRKMILANEDRKIPSNDERGLACEADENEVNINIIL